MKDIDSIAKRVQAAKANLVRQDANQERHVASLVREIADANETARKQHALLQENRAENERLQAEVRTINGERRRFKEMVMTLLTAVESRQKGDIEGAVEQVGAQAAQITAEQAPKNQIKAQDGAVSAHVHVDLQPNASSDALSAWHLNASKEESAH